MPGKENAPLYRELKLLASSGCVRSYLEIGVREGHSLELVLENANIEELVLCDTWGGEYGGTDKGSHDHILPMVSKVESVEFLDGDSKLLIPELTQKFDMILVDGDHSMLGCLTDMENCWKLLSPGGSMIVDDLTHPAHMYIEHCIKGFEIEHEDSKVVTLDQTGHGVAVIRKTT